MSMLSKRIISIITAVFMLITVFVVPVGPVYAEQDDNDIAWTEGVVGGAIYFDEETGTITGCDKSVTEAVIPEEINGVKVTGISSLSDELQEITLPESISKVGKYEFKYNSNLKKIHATEYIDIKGNECTYFVYEGMLYRSHKDSILTEEAVKHGYDEGYHLYIIPVCLPKDFPETEFVFPTSSEFDTLKDKTSKKNNCYYEYTLASGTFNPFYECKNLKSITFQNSPTVSASSALNRDPEEIIPNLENIYLSSNNKYLKSEDGVLYRYVDMWNIDDSETDPFPATKLLIYPDNNPRTIYEVRDGTNVIEDYAFYGVKNLKKIILPDGLIHVEHAAFYECDDLEEVVFPDTIVSLCDYGSTFSECDVLQRVDFPQGITKIPDYTIDDCDSLKNITIPESVKEIELPFYDGCPSMENIEVDENNENYMSENGVLYNKDQRQLLIYPRCNAQKEYLIPDTITSIQGPLISGTKYLEKVIIPNSVTEIAENAFYKCDGLNEVVFENGVKCISSKVICNCSDLTKVIIPRSVTSIADDAFYLSDYNMTIYGYSNSYAETYANENGIPFVALDLIDDGEGDKNDQDDDLSKNVITEEDLYGEYAYFLYKNDAYNAILADLYKVLEKATYKTSNDSSASAKAAMETVGSLDFIEYLKKFIGIDKKRDEIAEELALELIRDIDGKNDLIEYAMEHTVDEIEGGYENAATVNSVISKGITTGKEFTLVSNIFKNTKLVDPEIAARFLKEMADVWEKVGKQFEAAGVVINFTQLSLEILFTMEAENYVVTNVRDNVPKNSTLYKGLDAVAKKQEKSLESNLVKTYLQEGVFETIVNTFVEEGLGYASGAFKVAGLPFTLAAKFIPVSADDKVKALTADGNCAILSQAVKSKAVEIKENYDKGNLDKIDDLKAEYRILFEAYMHSIKNYKDYAYSVADKKTKREIDICYGGIEHWLTYEQYINSCLQNANAQWKYDVVDGKAHVKGVEYKNSSKTRSSAPSQISLSYAEENASPVMLSVPKEVDGYEVVRIDNDAAKGNTAIEHVFIPESVTSIGTSAFEGCISLKSVNMGDKVTSIEENAFKGCTGLSSVDLPYLLEEINDDAFSDIDNITINAVEGTVGATYAGNNSNCTFNESELNLSEIKISQMPAKLSYKMSEELDTAGMEVIATYEDGSTKDVTDDVYCEFEEKVLGTSNVNVIYGNKAVSYVVEVEADECDYSVAYHNEYGEEIAETVYGKAVAGTEIALDIKEIPGYIPDEASKTETIGAVNEFVVTYMSEPAVDISSVDFTPIPDQDYTGQQIMPDVELTYNGEPLIVNEDYYIEYNENIDIGQGGILIIGIGDFDGTTELNFNIIEPAKDIGSATVKLPYSNYSYTGKQRKPIPTVTVDGKKLTRGTDYTVSYGVNKWPGYGTVTITGKGDYTGTLTKQFTIAKVTGLKVKSTGTNQIKLSWNKQGSVKGYKVYQLKNGKYKLIKTIKASKTNYCTVKKLGAGYGYKFKVRAYAGTKPYYGVYSNILSAPTKPSRVVMSKLTTGKTHYVKATWKKKNGTGYQVMLATNSKFTKGKKTYKVTSNKTLSKKMTDLKKGKTYYVKVRAYKTYGGKTQYGQWSKYKSIKCK